MFVEFGNVLSGKVMESKNAKFEEMNQTVDVYYNCRQTRVKRLGSCYQHRLSHHALLRGLRQMFV